MTEAKATKPPEGTIPRAQVALLLMITGERVRQLQKLGAIPPSVNGRIPLVGAVQGYINWMKDEERRSSKSASASRVQDARAQEIELRVAERKREVIPLPDAIAAVDHVCGVVRSEMTALPSMVTRDIQLRRKIEDGVRGSLQRISDALRQSSEALQNGNDASANA